MQRLWPQCMCRQSRMSSMYGADKSSMASMYGADQSRIAAMYGADKTYAGIAATGQQQQRLTMDYQDQMKARDMSRQSRYSRGMARGF